MDVTFVIELAREIRDCVYVSRLMLKYRVYFYTTSGLSQGGPLAESCQECQKDGCGIFCCNDSETTNMIHGLLEPPWASWYWTPVLHCSVGAFLVTTFSLFSTLVSQHYF